MAAQIKVIRQVPKIPGKVIFGPGAYTDLLASVEWLTKRCDELVQWYTETNPESAREAKDAASVLPGGNTRTVLHQLPFSMALESGKGTLVTSKDGVEYLGFVSEYSAGMYGHSHPQIHKAVHEALDIGINLGSVIGKETEFANLIKERFPSMELMRFTNSGTEANTMAIAAAIGYTKQEHILVFKNGYHGSTLTFGENKPVTNLPHKFIVGTYNDIEATRRLLRFGIAAILVEPLQSAGGIIPATGEFLKFLRDAATTLNAVLIFDEIVTSRLDFYGLQGYHSIKPDMTTLGKYIGGGFSFGCFGGRKEIMQQFDPTRSAGHLAHSGTFNNNVFTMTAGIAGLKLTLPGEISRINALGDRIRESINELAEQHGLKDEVKAVGFGSMVGVHFQNRGGQLLRDVFYFELLKRQVVIGRRGFIALNLMHTEAHVNQFVNVASDSLGLLGRNLKEITLDVPHQ
ncbi:PLP-dependent transferase [Aaosphaeria arxii CBS 175.79]|uniref:PLP-dependent transferase n=1 Tax=Aaosphaeria arxii CBS 175.79 TaxID=1450172 RepID=A0A6A5X803_9PLEO|nr:PLP-dependent transferase [Aaosphaeria arxii CBS 175.79]KAF2009036.1 PLP-dependent transferase [Aaosphaeria arxii CBS 175.79]